MYYLVSVDHNSTAVHLIKANVKGFKNCCISNAVEETKYVVEWQ